MEEIEISKFKRDEARSNVKPQRNIEVQDVIDHFPFSKFRKYQKEVLEETVEAFNSGYRWILLETPTGFGKSPVNVSFCRVMRSFYTTPQNILLNQLRGDFPDLALIKGRKHYECAELLRGNCDEDSPCKRNVNYVCRDKYERCPYWIAKIQAINSQTALTNFAYFVGESFIHGTPNVPQFGNRELLVIDEGHSIDQHILNFISIAISNRTLPYPVFQSVKRTLLSLPKRLNQEQIDKLFEETIAYCLDYLETLPEELTTEQIKGEKKTRGFLQRVKTYQNNLDADWIGQIEKGTYRRRPWVRARIQPIYVKSFMHQYLWRRANKFIVSSATIFMHDFVKECGLSNYTDEVCYTHVPSTFPILNRMIIDAAAGSLSWTKKKETMPAALDTISKILAIEKGKGIIHAHSYPFKEEIKKGILNPRLMFHNSDDRQEVLNAFLAAPPERGAVLVAVAMTEGLDLKGDLATFQIMFKCPFPDLKDLRVYRRLIELKHNRWYNIQALKTTVQAYGRAVRSPTDKAAFYLIDSDISRTCKRWFRQLPRFFKEAYKAREQFP